MARSLMQCTGGKNDNFPVGLFVSAFGPDLVPGECQAEPGAARRELRTSKAVSGSQKMI